MILIYNEEQWVWTPDKGLRCLLYIPKQTWPPGFVSNPPSLELAYPASNSELCSPGSGLPFPQRLNLISYIHIGHLVPLSLLHLSLCMDAPPSPFPHGDFPRLRTWGPVNSPIQEQHSNKPKFALNWLISPAEKEPLK